MNKLKKCKQCKTYTFSDVCAQCNSPTSQPHPPKYSIVDKYAVYRRKEKFGL